MPHTNVVGTTAPPGSGAQQCAQAGEREHRIDSTAGTATATAADWNSVKRQRAGDMSDAICHRDAPVRCAGCGREVARRARQQLYCSQRCRQRAHRAVEPIEIGPRYPPSGGVTNPLEKDSKYNALQWAKTLSS